MFLLIAVLLTVRLAVHKTFVKKSDRALQGRFLCQGEGPATRLGPGDLVVTRDTRLTGSWSRGNPARLDTADYVRPSEGFTSLSVQFFLKCAQIEYLT